MAAEQAFLDAFIHNFSELFVFKSRRKALVAALGPVLSNAAEGFFTSYFSDGLALIQLACGGLLTFRGASRLASVGRGLP